LILDKLNQQHLLLNNGNTKGKLIFINYLLPFLRKH